jgi:hypothetical protein
MFNLKHNFYRSRTLTKIVSHSLIFKKTTQNEQPPNKRKFAKSGHPANAFQRKNTCKEEKFENHMVEVRHSIWIYVRVAYLRMWTNRFVFMFMFFDISVMSKNVFKATTLHPRRIRSHDPWLQSPP